MYILRLDDASDYSDKDKWDKIELLLNKYNIKPIVGVIPENLDKSFLEKYKKNNAFWEKVNDWEKKGWIIAMHGYQHQYITADGGINPVQKRSEFAGLSLKEQIDKISNAKKILNSHNIDPRIFFAPSHTFDINTLEALKKETKINIISDTIANDIYYDNDFFFIPVQSGKVRKLPFKTVTFCYHPNEMNDSDFIELEKFISKNIKKFKELDTENLAKRKKNVYDKMLSFIYFLRRKI